MNFIYGLNWDVLEIKILTVISSKLTTIIIYIYHLYLSKAKVQHKKLKIYYKYSFLWISHYINIITIWQNTIRTKWRMVLIYYYTSWRRGGRPTTTISRPSNILHIFSPEVHRNPSPSNYYVFWVPILPDNRASMKYWIFVNRKKSFNWIKVLSLMSFKMFTFFTRIFRYSCFRMPQTSPSL